MILEFNSGVVAKVRIPAQTKITVRDLPEYPDPIILLPGNYLRSSYNGDPRYRNTVVWSAVKEFMGVEIACPVTGVEAFALEQELQEMVYEGIKSCER